MPLTPSPSSQSMTRRVLKADQFEIIQQLGSGSFGAVYEAVDKITGQTVAIKKIDMENSDDDIEEIQKEISILAGCNNSRITRYYGSFVNGFKLWIIMEHLGGGSCLDLINSTGPFNESAIAQICYDLLRGLQYLHKSGKIHRDIKSANLLVSEHGEVKIADFGVAAQLSSNLSLRNTFVGTPFWMAPEVIGQKDYTYSADIWSLGITAIELATGKPPLHHLHPMEVLFYIPKNPAPRLDSKYSRSFCDFVEKCLQKAPDQRATVSQLLKHPFLGSCSRKELVNRVYQWKRNAKERKPAPITPTVDESILQLSDDDDSWEFDTVKPIKEKPPLSREPSNDFAPMLHKKLSRAGSNISLLKPKSSSSSAFSELSSISEISSRVPSPVTYQNFDLTPHNPLAANESSTSSYHDLTSHDIYETLPRHEDILEVGGDRRTHLVRVFSSAATKFNDRTLAEIADILTMEPLPSQVEGYLIKKLTSSESTVKGEHSEAPKYDSVETMFLNTWLNEVSQRV